MNYQRIYDNLILNNKDNQKQAGYEGHHIIPRSMGGSTEIDNIVFVPSRVHFILHILLFKIYRNKEMACAFMFMSRFRRYNSKVYSKLKSVASEFHPSKLEENRKLASRRMVNLNKRVESKERTRLQMLRQHEDPEFTRKQRLTVIDPKVKKKMAATKELNRKTEKCYEITFPDHSKIIILGLSRFCRKVGLAHQALSAVSLGKRTHHKGFTVKELPREMYIG